MTTPVAPLGVVSLSGATAYPAHRSMHEPHRMHFGVLRGDGTLLESTIDDRRHGTHTFVPPDTARFAAVESVSREAIYAGAFYDVYGHFLLEGLQRLWWAKARPDLPIVWMASDTEPPPELVHWQRDMLDVVGVHNETLVLTRPTRFDLLHVPDAGYKYADWSHPQQIQFLAAYEGPPQVDGRKLWLSRDPKARVGVINRHIIERRLSAEGWQIVTPELMPLRDQLDALSRAELVAGEEASTFHTLLLLKDISRKRFQIFRRHGPEHLSFKTIGDARHVDQQFYSCSRDAVLSVEGRAVVRLAPNPAQYLGHLGIPIPPRRRLGPDYEPSPAIRRLNRLRAVLEADSLLHVGWQDEAAFTRISVPHRDIVDEEFRFDVRSYRGKGAHFYEVTLEEFLTWFAKGRRYDFVMLDAAQDWRQALGHLRTVLAHAAHERTVVVLDNVLPAVEGSAPTDRAMAPLLRHQAGTAPEVGHGNVHKAVLAIHDLHPELSYRTVAAGGTAQTVIWPAPRDVSRRFSGEAAIAELDDNAVRHHLDLFQIVSEKEAVADVAGWLALLERDEGKEGVDTAPTDAVDRDSDAKTANAMARWVGRPGLRQWLTRIRSVRG